MVKEVRSVEAWVVGLEGVSQASEFLLEDSKGPDHNILRGQGTSRLDGEQEMRVLLTDLDTC